MNRPTRPVELPVVVSVRFPEADFRNLKALALSNRRTVSQVIRSLLEGALRQPSGARLVERL